MDAAITALKDAIYAAVIKLAAFLTNPKPTYSVEGQSFSWGEYLKALIDGIKASMEILMMLEPVEMRMVAT